MPPPIGLPLDGSRHQRQHDWTSRGPLAADEVTQDSGIWISLMLVPDVENELFVPPKDLARKHANFNSLEVTLHLSVLITVVPKRPQPRAMTPQTPTKYVSHQIQKKPETTPRTSQAHLPTPSPSPPPSALPLSHARKQQRHHHKSHHVHFNLAAVSSRIQISSSDSDKPSQSSKSVGSPSPTSSASRPYPASFSGLADFSGPLTPPSSKQTLSLLKPASHETGTERGPPCNTCHKPSTLYTVGPLNPKGNAGRKYFACRRCPYGLGWVRWADESFDGVFAVKGDGVGSVPVDSSGGGDDVDGRDISNESQPSGEGPVTSHDVGKRWDISNPGSREADATPVCCCGKGMKLDYVDVSWDVAFCPQSEERKKWFWSCSPGTCKGFLWVEDSGCFAPYSRSMSDERMENSVRILW